MVLFPLPFEKVLHRPFYDFIFLDTSPERGYLVHELMRRTMIHYEDVILFSLSKANQQVHRAFKSGLQPFGLTPVQGLVLHALYIEDGLAAGEIGKRLILDSATLSAVLERLEEGGWLARTCGKEDRRFTHVFLTAKALEAREPFLGEVGRINGEILGTLRPEERFLLERMLRDLRG